MAQPRTTTTKALILREATNQFNEHGTAAISTNHLAQALNLSPGNLYYHYRNKEDIIRAIFDQMDTEWEGGFQLSESPNLADLRRLLEFTFELQWRYRFLYRETVPLTQRDPQLKERFRQLEDRGRAGLEHLIRTFVQADLLSLPTHEIPRLALSIWLITEAWLPYLDLHEAHHAEQHQEGINLLMFSLNPYLKGDAP